VKLTYIVLISTQGDPAYHRQMQYFLKFWLCGTGGVPVQFTPLGRAWNANDGALGTTANAAFIAALYAKVARCAGMPRVCSNCFRPPDRRCLHNCGRQMGERQRRRRIWGRASPPESVCTAVASAVLPPQLTAWKQPGSLRAYSQWASSSDASGRPIPIADPLILTPGEGLSLIVCPLYCRSQYAAKADRYVCFARAQTRYMLGDASTSYMVGFGKKYSKFPQVMGASCPGFPVQGQAQVCSSSLSLFVFYQLHLRLHPRLCLFLVPSVSPCLKLDHLRGSPANYGFAGVRLHEALLPATQAMGLAAPDASMWSLYLVSARLLRLTASPPAPKTVYQF